VQERDHARQWLAGAVTWKVRSQAPKLGSAKPNGKWGQVTKNDKVVFRDLTPLLM